MGRNTKIQIEDANERQIAVYKEVPCFDHKTFLDLSSIDNEIQKSIKVNYSILLWTAGLKPSKSKLVNHFLDENQKIKVNKFMQINEYQNIFSVGDITFNENESFPSSAQVAMQQGFLAAQNIIALRNGNELKSFNYEDLGEMLSLGICNASITEGSINLFSLVNVPSISTATTFGFQLSGSHIIIRPKRIVSSIFALSKVRIWDIIHQH